jgi:HTH-type transcriptional regulator/antitoxin HigA
LSKEVIRKLAEYFKVKQKAFNRPYKLRWKGLD